MNHGMKLKINLQMRTCCDFKRSSQRWRSNAKNFRQCCQKLTETLLRPAEQWLPLLRTVDGPGQRSSASQSRLRPFHGRRAKARANQWVVEVLFRITGCKAKEKESQKGRHGSGKGFGCKHNNTFHMLSVDLPPEEMLFNPVQTSSSSERSLPTESLTDTGATATAGGKNAVRDLCKALVTARPDLKIDIHEQSRPWFRFGDGRWCRALYRVTTCNYCISDRRSHVNVSLTGMRELQSMYGRPVELQKNPKNHLILDYLKHVFLDNDHVIHEPNALRTSAHASPASTAAQRANSRPARRVSFAAAPECHVLDMNPLDIFFGEDSDAESLQPADPVCCFADEHLGVSQTDLQFPPGQEQSVQAVQSATPLHDGEQGGNESRDSEGCDSSLGRGGKFINSCCNSNSQGKGQSQGQLRRDTSSRPRRVRPSCQQDTMALHGRPHSGPRWKPIRTMGTVRPLRTEVELHTCNYGASSNHSCGSTSQRGGSVGETSNWRCRRTM